MKANIIKIGNSQGIILPSDILRRLHLSLKSAVNITVDGDQIVIKPSPRQGWGDAFKEFAESGAEGTFFPDFFEDEDLSWWTWKEKKQ